MKRRALALLAAAALTGAAQTAAALDFGLTISNDSTYTYQDAGTFQQANRALAWASAPVGGSSDFYLSALYEFKGSFASGSSTVEPWRLDLGRTEFSGSKPGAFGERSALRYSLGRIAIADQSALVLAGLTDGARLEADFGNASVSLSGGYRGLLYKGDAYSYLSAKDLEIAADEDEDFAPRRAVAGAGFKVAELVAGTDLGIELLGQFDLSGASDKAHSQYLEPWAKGRLGHLWSWGAWGVLEFMEAGDTSKAMAAGESLALSLPDKAGLKLAQKAEWASGDQGGLSYFSPIRRAPVDGTSYFAFTDLLKLSLEASLSPARGLSASLGTAAYFRSGLVDPESQKALESGAVYYRGFEVSGSASAKLSSDCSLNLSSAMLWPNTGSAYASGEKGRFTAELYAAFEL